ncbi:MAG: sigma-54-dependent Fis family transcriptional regulator [Micavibrio sp.]|nr:sigma-54-dependent Fis family transcriptional regulator [Micavibrio sp.]|tara:strand:- start:5392 stop:6882 length:1491 start_codon:yes stop_codon:yes gene_type:complete
MSIDILIVDDEEDIRNLIKGILEDEGYSVRTAHNSDKAYALISEAVPRLVILDIWLQGSAHDGLQILETIKQKHPLLPVLMISGHGTIETAVNAIKQGAYDFIEKPFKSDRLLLMIQRALENAVLKQENESLRQKVDANYKLLGSSSASHGLKQVLKRVAPTNSRILLSGEPGSGKEVAARFVHHHSLRADKPFMVLSCANLRPERLEIELFGVEGRGDDDTAYVGILEKVNGGTLLLDEVSDMPLETQGKIVRVLQNQSFHKIGGEKAIEVDVRIIASTNKDLEALIAGGAFRQDLYYRLNVVPVSIPPLRERAPDIQELVTYFSENIASSAGMSVPNFDDQALAAMQRYDWPGNVRQLKNVVEWVMIMNGPAEEQGYSVACLPPEISGVDRPKTGAKRAEGKHVSIPALQDDLLVLGLRDARESFERLYLSAQIEKFDGNVSKTAQFIGMERSALHRKLKSLNIVLGDKEPVRGRENASSDDGAVQELQNIKRA